MKACGPSSQRIVAARRICLSHFIPDTPENYFNGRRLELSLAATQTGILDLCPRLRRLQIIGRYGSH